MWNERCDALHGATEAETKQKKQGLVQRVRQCYAREMACAKFQYLYEKEREKLCARDIPVFDKMAGNGGTSGQKTGPGNGPGTRGSGGRIEYILERNKIPC